MSSVLTPQFPPPVPFEPPVAFTTAEIGRTITESDQEHWLRQATQKQEEEQPDAQETE